MTRLLFLPTLVLWPFFFLTFFSSLPSSECNEIGVQKLQQVFAWKQLTFNLENEEESDITNGILNQDPSIFNQTNNLPMGITKHKDRIFVSLPRRRLGIPATLNYISLVKDKGDLSPGLRPYPDLATNTMSNQKPFVTVYRTFADSCDRLWVIDTGCLELPGGNRNVQPPAISIYDLKTDKLIRRIELKKNVDYLHDESYGFASITVDIPQGQCSSAFAYLPDLANYGVVVYSFKENRTWRFKHNYFSFDPEQGDFDVNGFKFTWNDAVFSIALGPEHHDGYRNAYFHALASNYERMVSTKVLRNSTLTTRQYTGDDFKALGYKGPNTQTMTHAVHPQTKVMFNAQTGNNAITCWNTKHQLSPKTLGTVAMDNELLFYPSDLEIENDTIWIMVNSLPRFIYSKLNPKVYNFRIYKVSVHDAIQGTVCV